MDTFDPVYKAPPLELGGFSSSGVDIIIPFYGQYEKVLKLVESILLLTRSNDYRITLVDDFSPNPHYIQEFVKRKLTTHHNCKILLIRNKKRLGFGWSLEVGVERSFLEGQTKPGQLPGVFYPWLVFLNSDCLIENANWLYSMGETMFKLKSQGVKMVSARSNNPGEDCPDVLKGTKSDEVPDVILEEPEYLPLYCAMCHRDLFKHIGGFIKHYPLVGYEDIELAHRFWKYGYKQAVSGKSWVHHDGGATINSLLKNDYSHNTVLELNKARCVEDIQNLM